MDLYLLAAESDDIDVYETFGNTKLHSKNTRFSAI